MTRLPGTCSINGSHGDPEIVTVCGVGDFARPLKLEDADYLEMERDWFFHDSVTGERDLRYVAVGLDHVGVYCSSLRSGGLSDWRVPSGAELQALYDAFPSNQMYHRFDWPTGFVPFHTSDRNDNNENLSIRLVNGVKEWGWDFRPLPVACVR